MIDKIHISFSGGETSAWMTYYLLNVYYKTYWDVSLEVHVGVDPKTGKKVHVIVTFANTGQENEETLEFVKLCDEYFNFSTVWIEALFRFKIGGIIYNVIDFLDNILSTKWFGSRLGVRFKVVDFESADRKGIVYESFIARYGLPNVANASCTRGMKLRPMQNYLISKGWPRGSYSIAVGIRVDEIDRMSVSKDENRIFYPCISIKPMTKSKVNGFWSLQPFRLNLKGYQGNCKWCFKKHDPKLWQLAKESPEIFDFPIKMEDKYGSYITPDRLRFLEKNNKPIPNLKDRKYTFFRKGRSAQDILEESKDFSKQIVDDSQVYETESCEIYSSCGD